MKIIACFYLFCAMCMNSGSCAFAAQLNLIQCMPCLVMCLLALYMGVVLLMFLFLFHHIFIIKSKKKMHVFNFVYFVFFLSFILYIMQNKTLHKIFSPKTILSNSKQKKNQYAAKNASIRQSLPLP